MNAPQSTTPNAESGTKLVLIAVGVGLLAVIANYVFLTQREDPNNARTFPVYVLTQSVAAGQKIEQRHLRKINIPYTLSANVMDGLKAMPTDMVDLKAAGGEVYGRYGALNALVTFDLFTRENAVNTRMPEDGYRFMTLPVTPRATPPMLNTQQRVDIAAPFATGGARPDVLLVMENVEVVQVGSQPTDESKARSGSTYDTITIKLSQDEALELSAVKLAAAGPFEIYIRNPADNKTPKIVKGGINPRVRDIVSGRGSRSLPRIEPGPTFNLPDNN